MWAVVAVDVISLVAVGWTAAPDESGSDHPLHPAEASLQRLSQA